MPATPKDSTPKDTTPKRARAKGSTSKDSTKTATSKSATKSATVKDSTTSAKTKSTASKGAKPKTPAPKDPMHLFQQRIRLRMREGWQLVGRTDDPPRARLRRRADSQRGPRRDPDNLMFQHVYREIWIDEGAVKDEETAGEG